MLSYSPKVAAPAFVRLLDERAIHCVYQPIVHLSDRATVGFEALARGPAGTPWHKPTALIAAAAAGGRLPELDWICRAAACRGALDAGLAPNTPLFVNIEPATSPMACPDDLSEIIHAAMNRLRLVAEVTERSITDDPATLLATTDLLRRESVLVGLDDVGTDPASQAIMPLIAPDVIKIDRSIVHEPDTRKAADVIAAVQAEALRNGAVILAEGIETRRHLAFAQSIGATLGQGWYLGRPGPLPPHVRTAGTFFPQTRSTPATGATPFDVVLTRGRATRVSIHTMLALSRTLEDQGVHAGEPTILLATFQHADRFNGPTRQRYGDLAANTVLTAVFATDMDPEPAPKVRGYALAPDDPLTADWTVITIGSRHTRGIFARQSATVDPRTFDVIVSDDRDLVVAAARQLIDRTTPQSLRDT
jgi:EAL domain-containing protein (putative c-di-GMP-specific phosphodiesterase class I)